MLRQKAIVQSPMFQSWSVNIYKTGKIKIGCQYHVTQEWENFTDSEIAKMSPFALKFWNKNKNTIISLAKIYQGE